MIRETRLCVCVCFDNFKNSIDEMTRKKERKREYN